MAFQMSLRDDDTYTYIKNNLVFTGPPVVPIENRFVPPYGLVGGKYYSWVWNGTYWALTDNDSTIYTETEPPNQSATSSAPSPIIPYNGFGYYCIGTSGGAIKVKKINLLTNVVTTIQAYSVTHSSSAECAGTVYGNYALFVGGLGNSSDLGSQTEVSLEVIKVLLPSESCTQLYSSDVSLSSANANNSIGCDGTDVFVGCSGRSSDRLFSIPFSGGGITNIGTESDFNYGERGWGRRGSTIYDWRTSTIGDQKEWSLSGYLSTDGIAYIIEDDSYPVYVITSDAFNIHMVKLNSDETITLLETINGLFNNQPTVRPLSIFYNSGRSVLYFPSCVSGRNSVEIRLPYRDVL
jgi:hypothetical protein